MKFKKQPNTPFFSKYTREDGKYTIESTYTYTNGKPKAVFEVTDEKGNVVDTFLRLKDAKAKYSEEDEEVKEEKKMTVKELRAKAKEMGIKGYSRMSKEQLKAEIEGIDSFLSTKGKTILMKAFTGMVIGKFEVVGEEGVNISVKTKKGLLTFNKETGIQVDANNPRFANKFEWA